MTDILLPPPPPPADLTATTNEKEEAFAAAVVWICENYGLLADGEKRGAGLIVPLRTRLAVETSIAAFKTKMLPYRLEIVGPRGGITRVNPVDLWLAGERVEVVGFRTAPDKAWPTFVGDEGKLYVNLYKRPVLPENGDATMGHDFLKVVLPDERERAWFKQRLGHLLRHPEIPGPTVIMVARGTFGVGRDTFYRLLERMFGEEYVAKPTFDMAVGQGSQGQFNDWMADSVLALIDEALSTESNRYQRKHEAFEELKRNFEPARKRRSIKRKFKPAEMVLCGPAGFIATNNPQPFAIADGDRRFTFLTNGAVQKPAYYAALNAWMADPANVGAFRASLEAVSLEGFNPYQPLHTRLKDIVIADSKSDLDEAVATAVEAALPGKVFCIHQVCEAMQWMAGDFPWTSGPRSLPQNWQIIVRSIVMHTYHAVGVPKGRNWQPEFEGRRRRTFARTDADAKAWTRAIPSRLRQELQKNQAAIAALEKARGKLPPLRIVNTAEPAVDPEAADVERE